MKNKSNQIVCRIFICLFLLWILFLWRDADGMLAVRLYYESMSGADASRIIPVYRPQLQLAAGCVVFLVLDIMKLREIAVSDSHASQVSEDMKSRSWSAGDRVVLIALAVMLLTSYGSIQWLGELPVEHINVVYAMGTMVGFMIVFSAISVVRMIRRRVRMR